MARRGDHSVQAAHKAARAQIEDQQRLVAQLSKLQSAFLTARDAGDWDAARSALIKLRAALPASGELRVAEAKLIFDHFSEDRRAAALIAEALPVLEELGPKTNRTVAEAYELLSSIHIARGEMEAAKEAAQRSLSYGRVEPIALINLIKIDKEAAAAYEPLVYDAVREAANEPLRAAFLLNALGLLREAAEDYESAWKCFAGAKAASHPGRMDMDGSEAVVQEARAVFSPDFFAERRQWGSRDTRPVFVVGLPRSGTTLVERILAAHPEVAAAGEISALGVANEQLGRRAAEVTDKRVGRYAHLLDCTQGAARKAAARYLETAQAAAGAPGAARIVDKLPANFAHVGLIALLFPKARIIHVARDPMDVFISSFKEMFLNPQPHTHDPMSFAHYAILHEELMTLWRGLFGDRILNVRYEDIVADLPTEARRMVEHVGLDWDEACAAPHEAAGKVMTASAAQVRAPVHSRSVGRWRRYEAQLAPLKEILERYAAAAAASEEAA